MSVKRRPIPGFENYSITSSGAVYNSSGKRMKPTRNEAGYFHIVLRAGRGKRYCRYIHRLVALAWLPNPESKPQVNHKNHKKADNRKDNLVWATSSENMKHIHAGVGR